jgi:hypothetical protein
VTDLKFSGKRWKQKVDLGTVVKAVIMVSIESDTLSFIVSPQSTKVFFGGEAES